MNPLEYIEYGLTVGYKAALLEAGGEISFTKGYDLDDQFSVLAQQLINEFTSDIGAGHYFSEYVERRLKELDVEKK